MGKRSLNETAESAVSETAGDVTAPTTEKDEYQALCELVNPIAQPLANRKLAKKVYKLIKKAAGEKSIREGIKDVQKELRRKEKGICILAGNVSPIDVYSHIPAICEEREVPYVYIPSREQLGLAVGHRRPSILIFVKPQAGFQELYDEVAETLHHLTVEAA